jgi:hypothetical protein
MCVLLPHGRRVGARLLLAAMAVLPELAADVLRIQCLVNQVFC